MALNIGGNNKHIISSSKAYNVGQLYISDPSAVMKSSLNHPGSGAKVPRANLRMSSDSKNVTTKLPDHKTASGFSSSKYIAQNMEEIVEAAAFTGFAPADVTTKTKASVMDEDVEFDAELDEIAELFELEFGVEHNDGPVVFGDAPEIFTGHLDVEFGHSCRPKIAA
jgi:hypothetical protein